HGAADPIDGKGKPAIFSDTTKIPDSEFERGVPSGQNTAGFDVLKKILREGLTFYPGFYMFRIGAVREAVRAGGGVSGVVVQTDFAQVEFGIGLKIPADTWQSLHRFLPKVKKLGAALEQPPRQKFDFSQRCWLLSWLLRRRWRRAHPRARTPCWPGCGRCPADRHRAAFARSAGRS